MSSHHNACGKYIIVFKKYSDINVCMNFQTFKSVQYLAPLTWINMCMLGPRGWPSGDKFDKNVKDEEIDAM